MRNLLTDPQQQALLQQSRLGVEVEEHRIDQAGQLSRAPHPPILGSRQFHPYFQSDFAETQAELITDPHSSMTKLSQQLATLQMVFTQAMQPDELIWPLSLPPAVSTADLDFIAAHFERPAYQSYRDYLLAKYGIPHEITTGSHVSFSLPAALLAGQSIATRNQIYFHIVQNFMLTRWLLTYLFGATPQAAANYFATPPAALKQPVRSIRNSQYGFTNDASERVSYSSLSAHLAGIDNGVSNGDFYSAHEFYGPVRLKNQEHLAAFKTQGIDYLEFRTFDLDPFSASAISLTTLRFFKVFLSYLAVRPLPADLPHALAAAQQKNHQVALERPDSQCAFATEMHDWLHQLQIFSQSWPTTYQQAVATIAQRVDRPALTPSAKLVAQPAVATFALQQARRYHQEHQTQPLPEAAGLNHDQRQLLIAAYQRGLRINHQAEQIQLCGQQQVISLQQIDLNGLSAAARLTQLFPELQQKSS
ncbi:gamma-glutamylcysteine synthetase [Loigolactobacillus jiayinensis]|uniref:Glutamate--cysteine ligase n=1 Tax=Loigolactobacillus jiayinensis TaxID=2486016 RepID=A0ABW1REH6_9LACO|nr:gamma-glutamylcysteine synthetase [Loigolactobacillus jiayinensis]